MTDITVNILNYDETKHTLVVSFTYGDIQTESISIEPAFYNKETTDETMKYIAQLGLLKIKDQQQKNAYNSNQTQIDAFKALVGQTVSYTEVEIQTLSELEVQI
jgi:hypothetical protein